ncbi:hypothetical protein LOTGIDRAFT_114173 [Lottia gigantea]|uniref:NADP-dependent oxidoreductase domain-containing protein n=1 Tax=Lottia gigantea TaxID=225164 RepID=V4CAV9_LOTGI|nr:hypothetical protein LOTGIDRAFT_114173 [Lottia gigantea]ESO98959.1 hypothetical protein LOTGIDRAFT_114173 [Lottia gigantea]
MAMVGPFITFNNGVKFPQFGLGTWQSTKEECQTAIRAALDAGYRHFDSAFAYGNEADIGEVINEYIKAGKIEREDVFITTKLWSTFHDKVEEGFKKSLDNLNLGYIDLFLCHNPMAFEDTGSSGLFPTKADGSPAIKNIPIETSWADMEKLVATGKCKSIGVSNYGPKQIERLVQKAKIKPVTNQVECHAYFPQDELYTVCKKHKITLTSYATLASPGRPAYIVDDKHPILLQDPVIKKLAEKYKKSAGQILLRQMVQRGILVIPKSVNPKRIKENSEIFDFELSPADVKQIESLNKSLQLFKVER